MLYNTFEHPQTDVEPFRDSDTLAMYKTDLVSGFRVKHSIGSGCLRKNDGPLFWFDKK